MTVPLTLLGIVETFLSLGDAITELLDIPACEYGAWDVHIQLLFFSQGVYKNPYLHFSPMVCQCSV